MISFVFTNPRHHLEMFVPVARELVRAGRGVQFVSLAELRGFETPALDRRLPGVPVMRAVPPLRRDPSMGAKLGSDGRGRGASLRDTVRSAVWLALGLRLRWLLRGSDLVVVPNDIAFPYDALIRDLDRRRVPFALVQEGIRFPVPKEKTVRVYGTGGAATICAWGEASAAHFRAIGAVPGSVKVTGTPRFDDVVPANWRPQGEALRVRLGLTAAPLLFLSNTIDDLGYCTTAEKMALFEQFLRTAGPVVAKAGRSIVVKLHPREDLAAFRAAAATAPAGLRVDVVDEPLFDVLALGRAAVVLASTVGLEAIVFGLPLGILEIPGHGHAFEYVSGGAARGLHLATLATDTAALLEDPPATTGADAFLDRHMAHRGSAAAEIARGLISLQTSLAPRGTP